MSLGHNIYIVKRAVIIRRKGHCFVYKNEWMYIDAVIRIAML